MKPADTGITPGRPDVQHGDFILLKDLFAFHGVSVISCLYMLTEEQSEK
jgi:hypothetical protein